MKFSDILAIAEDSAFIHPDGKKVPAVVHTAIYKKSGNGNDMLVLTYRVTGGPNAGKGRPIRHYVMFDRDTGKQIVSNLGFPVKDFATLAGLDAEEAIGRIAATVVGKPCAIDIEQETFNDRLQNKIKWAHPAGTAQTPKPAAAKAEKPTAAEEPAPAEEEDELTRLKRQVVAAEAKAESNKSSRTAPPDDLPF